MNLGCYKTKEFRIKDAVYNSGHDWPKNQQNPTDK